MRHLKIFFASVACILAFSAILWAAGTTSTSYTNPTLDVACLTYSWTGASPGGTPATAQTTNDLDGWIFLVVTDPGTPAPTDDYDVTLTDEDGVDVMGGELGNRDTANSEQAVPLVDAVYGDRFVAGKLQVNITNNTEAGAQGEVKVYYYRYLKSQ